MLSLGHDFCSHQFVSFLISLFLLYSSLLFSDNLFVAAVPSIHLDNTGFQRSSGSRNRTNNSPYSSIKKSKSSIYHTFTREQQSDSNILVKADDEDQSIDYSLLQKILDELLSDRTSATPRITQQNRNLGSSLNQQEVHRKKSLINYNFASSTSLPPKVMLANDQLLERKTAEAIESKGPSERSLQLLPETFSQHIFLQEPSVSSAEQPLTYPSNPYYMQGQQQQPPFTGSTLSSPSFMFQEAPPLIQQPAPKMTEVDYSSQQQPTTSQQHFYPLQQNQRQSYPSLSPEVYSYHTTSMRPPYIHPAIDPPLLPTVNDLSPSSQIFTARLPRASGSRRRQRQMVNHPQQFLLSSPESKTTFSGQPHSPPPSHGEHFVSSNQLQVRPNGRGISWRRMYHRMNKT